MSKWKSFIMVICCCIGLYTSGQEKIEPTNPYNIYDCIVGITELGEQKIYHIDGNVEMTVTDSLLVITNKKNGNSLNFVLYFFTAIKDSKEQRITDFYNAIQVESNYMLTIMITRDWLTDHLVGVRFKLVSGGIYEFKLSYKIVG